MAFARRFARVVWNLHWVVVFGYLLSFGRAQAMTWNVEEFGCGAAGEWRCYVAGTTAATPIVTTFDQPDVDIVVQPIFPSDPANWRIINVHFFANGSADFLFDYPDSSFSGRASLPSVSFYDATGTLRASIGRALSGFCFDAPAGFRCADGNVLGGGQEFGEVDLGFTYNDLDPNLPSLAGPIAIRVDWDVFGDAPTQSSLRINGLYFGYVLAPVPEPGSALLIGIGLSVLAASGERR